MRKKLSFVLIALIMAGCGAQSTALISSDLPTTSYKDELAAYEQAQLDKRPTPSLWADANTYGTIFLDYKARLVGDVIIVRIEETANASNNNSTGTDRTSAYNATITNLMGLPLNMGVDNLLNTGNAFDPTIAATTANSFSGSGTKQRSDSVSATIAARVIEILPSGNLVIEGQREIIIDQEKQTIGIRGIVRQKDIDASNTVLSSAIADAQIRYYGDGIISDANKKGWMARFIDWVWPF